MKSLRYHNRKVSVTKRFTFDSAHRLDEYVGKCSNLHGHTYQLEVEVKGRPDGRGIVVDFTELKRIVHETVIGPLDHTFLNDTLPFNTTAENMVVYFYDKIAEQLEDAVQDSQEQEIALERVRLWETPTCFAEVTKEDMKE